LQKEKRFKGQRQTALVARAKQRTKQPFNLHRITSQQRNNPPAQNKPVWSKT